MKLSRTRACSPWKGHCNSKSGHGQRWDAALRVTRGAHVMAWEEANGRRVQAGEVVRHTCDNPPCVEPSHLLIGSRQDNYDDMVERHPERVSLPPCATGEWHPRHKLSDADVLALRESYSGARGEKAALARQYGISQTQVSNLLEGRQRACA